MHDASRVRYVVDSSANFSSRVKVPNCTITGFSHVVKPHTYRTNYGDPRMQEGKGTTFSQYNFALALGRSGMGMYFKFFIGLLTIRLSVAASLTSAYFFSHRDEKDFSRELDQVSCITIGIGFLAINITLPISAMH